MSSEQNKTETKKKKKLGAGGWENAELDRETKFGSETSDPVWCRVCLSESLFKSEGLIKWPAHVCD